MNPESNTGLDTGIESQAELAAEDLIEEVSIDGMCGVY
ncbi:mycofactocin precursor MftA [Nocardioides sp. LHD-245]|nr:mycofactocin precursor MftA [Nocardioides sp. LHD-245]